MTPKYIAIYNERLMAFKWYDDKYMPSSRQPPRPDTRGSTTTHYYRTGRMLRREDGEIAEILEERPWTDLQSLGIGYLENLGGSVDSSFPHSHFTFELSVDRDCMIARMRDAHDEVTDLCCVDVRRGLHAAFEEVAKHLRNRFSSL